jgi:hypothetical protein
MNTMNMTNMMKLMGRTTTMTRRTTTMMGRTTTTMGRG